MEHTPGPWKSSPTYPAGQFVIYSQTAMGPGEHQMRTVARCKEEADAHLIAAAPELYAALVAAQDELRCAVYHPALLMQIDNALALARGESP